LADSHLIAQLSAKRLGLSEEPIAVLSGSHPARVRRRDACAGRSRRESGAGSRRSLAGLLRAGEIALD
jgi:hypothetical protein